MASSDDKNPKEHLVFCYGTLKRGEGNAYHMNETGHGTARFIAYGRTKEKYPLIIATKWNIPFALDFPGMGHQLPGNIFAVDDEMLTWLDAFEGHPEVYTRTKVKVIMDKTDSIPCDLDPSGGEHQELDCWFYVMEKYKEKLLKKKIYTSYDGSLDECQLKPDEDLTSIDSILRELERELESDAK